MQELYESLSLNTEDSKSNYVDFAQFTHQSLKAFKMCLYTKQNDQKVFKNDDTVTICDATSFAATIWKNLQSGKVKKVRCIYVGTCLYLCFLSE